MKILSIVLGLILLGGITMAWMFAPSKFIKNQQSPREFGQMSRDISQTTSQEPSHSLPIPSPLPSPSVVPTRRVVTRAPVQLQISDGALWSALSTYRRSNERTELVHEEKLCDYGKSRAKELVDRSSKLQKNESSLDEHAGFKRDAASGDLFTQTGFHAVAENLAYIPDAQTAIQVIEWGWDSSSAHRETQLSNDWTHACIAGISPFYVGIFAHN